MAWMEEGLLKSAGGTVSEGLWGSWVFDTFVLGIQGL